jgi:hypothetical protein
MRALPRRLSVQRLLENRRGRGLIQQQLLNEVIRHDRPPSFGLSQAT